MKNIKLSSPWIGEEEIEAATRVLKSQVLNMGSETKEFEIELKKFWNRSDSNIACVNSCTAALQLAVQACGIKPGDEVLVPTYTFVSTFQAVKAAGAIPVPCDIDLDDAFISLDDAKKRLSKKTKAIIPVLFAGCDSKIERVYDFALENNLKIVEDAAHSFGDENIIKRNGILCFSFDAIKNLSCGDGGAIVTSDSQVFDIVKDARLLGVIGDTDARFNGKRTWDPEVQFQGWRYHMSNLNAAIGKAQLSKFSKISEKRKKFSGMYLDELSNIKDLKLFPINNKTAVPHIFPVIIQNGKRNELKQYLLENGIQSGVQYKPNHLLKFFNLGYALPNSEELYGKILSIPLHPMLSEDDVLFIIEKIKDFFK